LIGLLILKYSLLGKIKCDKDYTGAYRIAESGMFSAVKEEEKERINMLSRKIIMDKVYEMKKMKKILIGLSKLIAYFKFITWWLWCVVTRR